MTAQSIDEVLDLFERHGAELYDEEIFQLAHAEQTAALAQAAGATDAVVAAALLHDVGHLLEVAERQGARDRTTDQRHEARGSAWLAGLFPPAVTAPIALHVRAKRYLCAVDPTLPRRAVARFRRQPRAPGRPAVRRRGGRLRGQPRLGGRRRPPPLGRPGQGPRPPRSPPPVPTAPSSSPSARSGGSEAEAEGGADGVGSDSVS